MTNSPLGSWLASFSDAIRRERIWRIGLLTGLRFEKQRGYYPPNFERGLVLDRLCELRRPKRVLEIGTGRGLGAISVWAAADAYNFPCRIDTYDVIPPDASQDWALETEGRNEVRQTSCAKIWGEHFPGWETRIYPHTGLTTTTLPALLADPTCRYDLIFIDGGHDLFSVVHDLCYSALLLAPGGAILMDDFAPLEPWGVGVCIAAAHARRFFSKVEIFPTEGLVFGGADHPESRRSMVLLDERSGSPSLSAFRLLGWRAAGFVLDLCFRSPLFPLQQKKDA